MKKVLAIDPATIALGWCVMEEQEKIIDAGLLHISKGDWIRRVSRMNEKIFKIYRKFMPSDIVIELPEHWSGSVGFAARESGSIHKLVFLVGSFYGIVKHNNLAEISLMTPSQWKGQLPKKIAHNRLRRKMTGIDHIKDHNVLDAVGIGHVFLGGKL